MQKKKLLILTPLIIFAILGIFFLTILLIPLEETFQFKFYINETGEILDGKVYLNDYDNFLGVTHNGTLVVNKSDLYPGKIILNGTYNGVPIEYYWDLTKEDLENYDQIDYYVTEEDIKSYIEQYQFDVSKQWDLRKLEKRIFDLVNWERQKYSDIRALRWNEKLADIARSYSQYMLSKNQFLHGDLDNRLQKANFFYLSAAENIYLTGIVNASSDIAKEAVESWLKSPGHRSVILDLDNIYTDAGVGIACAKDYCYVTMDFVQLAVHDEQELDGDMCWLVTLYDPTSPFDQEVKIKLSVNASERLHIYIVKDESAFDDCIRRHAIDSVKEYYSKNVSDEVVIKKGYSILFKTNKETLIEYSVDYSS